MEKQSPIVENPATCLVIAMVAGAVLGFIMHLDQFNCQDLHKPFLAISVISWFPWAPTKFHSVKTTQSFWGLAILVSFVGWDAMARIVDRGVGC